MKVTLAMALLMLFANPFLRGQTPRTDPDIERIVAGISADSIRATIERLAAFGTRHTLSDTISATSGIGAARRWIYSQFERHAMRSAGRLSTSFQEAIVEPSRRVRRPANIVNVVATLAPKADQTSSHERVFIVGGHYDSRASDVMDSVTAAPGADDDGSGTAVVLELSRVMTKYDFNATIVFLCFAGEEQGLLGSTAWVEWAGKKGIGIEAMLNNDIVGGLQGDDRNTNGAYVRVFSEAFASRDSGKVFQQRNSLGLENDGASRSLARYVKETGERYVPGFGVEMIYRLDRFLRGGDHIPFHQAGYAAVRLSEAHENYDHQHQDVRVENGRELGDLPKFVNYAYCANVARVNAAALASLARAPASPSHASILTSRLEDSTRLAWKPNSDQQLAGYMVRWRKTSAATWESSIFTADTSIVLKVSKDDYLFGVQSVDRSGNASLVSIPLPAR
jgi:peptidase M28-like protein